MKKFIILLLLVPVFSFGQTARTTSSGRGYLENFIDSTKITIIYLHGHGERGTDLNKIKATNFYTKFYNAFKNKYNILMPQQTTSFSGWENKINNVPSGADFVRWAIDYYNLTKKPIVTGHSAGATWETLAALQDEIAGFAPVAGRGLSYAKVVQAGKNKIPVNAWHGEKDTTTPNDYAAGKQAITWYKSGGGVPVWNVIPGCGHGSDAYAYKADSGLSEWIDSLYPAEVLFVPGVYINGVYAGDGVVNYDCDGNNLLIEYKTQP